MNRSESITELAAALSKAQADFTGIGKSGTNPQLRNRYATLDDVIDGVRGPLTAQGLSFVQPLSSDGDTFTLETILLHTSGEWLSCAAVIPTWAGNKAVNELQAFGGALTYMRRYMLSSLLGVNSDDDADGNGKPQRKVERPAPEPEPVKDVGKGEPAPAEPVVHHWIEDPQTRKRFWAWTRNDLGLTDDQVHAALNAEHIGDYPGTAKDAKSDILAWVEKQGELLTPATATKEAYEL